MGRITSDELRLAVKELHGLMIRAKDKGFGFELMAPVTQCSHYGTEFFVMRKVIEFKTTKLLTEVGQGTFQLGKNNSNAHPASITLYLK